MKRLILIVLFCFVIATVAYGAAYDRISYSRTPFARRGTVVQHRVSVSRDDTAHPAVGSGVDLTEWNYALLDINFEDTDAAAATVQPLFGNSTANEYHSLVSGEVHLYRLVDYQQSYQVSGDTLLIVPCYGSDDFYVYITEKSTGSFVTIDVTPYNN